MLKIAKLVAATKTYNPFQRDDLLFKALAHAEADILLNRKESAIAAVIELRRTAISLPSGNLLRLANIQLFGLDKSIDHRAGFDAEAAAASPLPEIVATQWIDQTPVKLSALRGQVVLLDFWAPLVRAMPVYFPKTTALARSYKDKGLVILGVTNYFGHVEGRKVTPTRRARISAHFQENKSTSLWLCGRRFRGQRHELRCVFDSHVVFDRPRGNVRYISMGANEPENAAARKMLEKVLAEPADHPPQAARQLKPRCEAAKRQARKAELNSFNGIKHHPIHHRYFISRGHPLVSFAVRVAAGAWLHLLDFRSQRGSV